METDKKILGIETVVFDLGGVVIDLDRDRAVRCLEEIGMTEAGQMLDLYCQSGPFLDLETGRLTAGEFFDKVRPMCRPGTTDADIQEAFNGFLIGLPQERLATLRRLRDAGYQVLALSNTNPVMFHSWIASRFRQEGLSINDYFSGVVASFAEGCCKPDKRIFEILIRRYGLNPQATLYLDDGEANCKAAAACGLRTEHIRPDNTMIDVANRLL